MFAVPFVRSVGGDETHNRQQEIADKQEDT